MANINIYDRTLKIIARNYADSLLALAFPDMPIRLLGTLENVELSLPVRPVDFVHRIAYAEQEYILHLEFQLEHTSDFARRLCGYYGALTEQFQLPVLTLVLYLQPRRAAVPSEYATMLGDLVVNRFTYPVLKLWEYVDEIAAGRYPGLVPLLTMLIPHPDAETLRLERQLILAEPDQQKRGELLSLAVTIASRYFDKTFLWRFFKEELAQMREASFIEDWIKEGIEQGLAQGLEQGIERGIERGMERGMERGIERGLQKGKLEGLCLAYRENITWILQARFNLAVPEAEFLKAQLELISDLERLRQLFDHALHLVLLQDFYPRLNFPAA